MTLDEQISILQAAKRGEKIESLYKGRASCIDTWINYDPPHEFNFQDFDYRIVDPYAELKAAAKDPTKQIRVKHDKYASWQNSGAGWCWDFEPNEYEIRDKPKEPLKKKYLCYIIYGHLHWAEESVTRLDWKRRPAFDMECFVDDEGEIV